MVMMFKLKRPKWAKRLERMMAKVEEKLAEMEAVFGPLATALPGIKGDLQTLTASLATQSAEIAALKQTIQDGQSNPGELSPEIAARFDALIQSVKEAATAATELDAQLPNVAPADAPTA
jgi:hypothetical protein